MKRIIVVACQLHYSAGSECAVAMDYIRHMSVNNELTVLYGTAKGFHDLGNTHEMEEWCKINPLKNVTFLPIKPSFVSHNYGYSIFGNFKFYRQDYRMWHKDVRNAIVNLCKNNEYDIIHFLGPIGYREPGCMRDLGLPYIWGPIGGFGMAPIRLSLASSLMGGGASYVKRMLECRTISYKQKCA